MELVDIFTQDAFNLISMTDAIEMVPYQPKMLGSLGIFEAEPIATDTVALEREGSTIAVLPTKSRNSPGTPLHPDKRDVRSFQVPHIPHDTVVMASDVQNVRVLGQTDQLESVARVVNKRLQKMRANHETTFEWHRIGAVKGLVVDADGSTLFDLYSEFGLTEQTVDFDFSAATDIKLKCTNVIRQIEDALGGDMYNEIIGLCGNTFWDELLSHADVKAAYDRYQAGAVLRSSNSLRSQGFVFGDIRFINYRGSVGGTKFIADGDARFFPTGVSELFKHYMAPADMVETVNTLGRQVYARQELMKHGRGVDIHTQSNPLIICQRPKVLIKGTNT